MSIIPDVKCSRCDRLYPGWKAKCPYCGAGRFAKGKYADEDNGRMWKLLITALLLTAFVVALIVVIAGSTREKRAAEAEASASAYLYSLEQAATPSPTPTATPAPTPTPVMVENVRILYGNSELAAQDSADYRYDVSLKVAEVLKLTAQVLPQDIQEQVTITWASEDEDVVAVLQTGEITGLAPGTTYVTVSAGNISVKMIVRVHE